MERPKPPVVIEFTGAYTPMRKTKGSAGYDLQAAIEKPITVNPGRTATIPTGISVAIPEGYVGFVIIRSGLCFNGAITLANGVGVIDPDFRGEIQLHLKHNDIQAAPFTIQPNQRVAQLLLLQNPAITFQQEEKLSETERGQGGFGSTGAH
jgi:dUTP pyrophosphatase